jgi:UDP-glucose 4-epimerase
VSKKILVTGGSGFIGSYVIEELLSQGYKVLTFDHSMPGHITDPMGPRAVEHFMGDIRDSTAVTEAAAHVDGIIHLAAVLGTQETISNPRPAAETNILGALNVFEAASQYDLPVVYAGVGNHFMRFDGGGTYTISKSAVEDFAKMYVKNRGSKISVVRPVNAYGPRQSVAHPYGSSKVRKIMPSFICRALMGDDIEVYGGGTQVSDCVYVADVAKTFVAALQYTEKYGSYWSPGAIYDAFEVGPLNYPAVSVKAIAELVVKIADSNSRIVTHDMRPGETPNAIVTSDPQTLTPLEEFGLDQNNFVPLRDGIFRTVRYYNDYLRKQKML